MECETDNTASEDEAKQRTSVQQTIDMLEHNIQEHVKHSKGLLEKPMVQGALKQTLENIKIKSHPLRTTAVKDSTREERRASCTHQCKECSNQSTQNPTQQPENGEDNQWRVIRSKKRGRNSPDHDSKTVKSCQLLSGRSITNI